MQPYLTGRMLQQSDALAPLGALAVQHRERLDGSGYPRGPVRSGDLPARRDPGRRRRLPVDARAPPVPAGALGRGRRGRAAGRGQGGATRRRRRRARCSSPPATASGAGGRGRPGSPLARSTSSAWSPAGCRARRSRRDLVISPKTARNHIEHIYTKTGATSRVTASLFAMQHGLIPDDAGERTRDRWGSCPMTGGPAFRTLPPRSPVHEEGGNRWACASTFFALTYDRQIAKVEKAGLRARPAGPADPGDRRRCSRSAPEPGANLAHYGPGSRVADADRAGAAHVAPAPAASATGPSAAPTVLRAPAEDLPFDDDSFDVVVSTLVLCGVSDQPRALREIHRVLRPGGRASLHRARALRRRPARPPAGPDEQREPLPRRLRVQPADPRHDRTRRLRRSPRSSTRPAQGPVLRPPAHRRRRDARSRPPPPRDAYRRAPDPCLRRLAGRHQLPDDGRHRREGDIPCRRHPSRA